MSIEEMGRLKTLVFNEEAIREELKSPKVSQARITKMLAD
jgi:hypothetical protein